jgi:signal transduction histidine kinase
MAKINFAEKKLSIVFLATVFTFITIGTFVITKKQTERSLNLFEDQLSGLTKSSTVYLIKNFELYYPAVKYKTIAEDFVNDNHIVESYIIFNTEGKIAYNSSTHSPQDEKVSDEILKKSKNNELSYIRKNRKITGIIFPHFEEWGAHKYSIYISPSYNDLERAIFKFNLEASVISFLLMIALIASTTTLILSEENRLEKKEKEKLELIDKQRKEFMILSTHNLRTPLTIIKGNIDLLKHNEKFKRGLESDMIKSVEDSTNKLDSHIESIIAITNAIAAPKDDLLKEQVSLLNSINSIVSSLKEKINDKKINIEIDVADKVLIETHKRYLEMILKAIIDNAVKFNPEKGDVIIKAGEKDGFLVISIEDEGIGISDAEKENIFKGFHRAEAASENLFIYNQDGFGLGLYMANTLTKLLGGNIHLKSKNKGTIFFIEFPFKYNQEPSK